MEMIATVYNGDILHSSPEFVEWVNSQTMPPLLPRKTYVVIRVNGIIVEIGVYQVVEKGESRGYELFPLSIPASIAAGMKAAWETVDKPATLNQMLEIVARHIEFRTKTLVDHAKLMNHYGDDFGPFLIFQDWIDAYNDEAFMATRIKKYG